MNDHREISLTRDCDAIQIPSGHPIVLPEGMDVIITQSLGGTYTVATPGGLARIELKDGDALGFDPLAPAESPRKHEGPAEEAVWLQLKTVFDPEIPVNVVDLGLIYDCRVDATESGTSVLVRMTLTAPGCGMGPAIAADARQKILAIEGVDDAEVELVWDPPWNQSMISEEGRMKLGLV
ncbi:MAG TPA: putative Fe-S cluster assembly protein SufT [Terrimicrobiaceae bacterium]|jgi:probable FeS assembly SUF system protein SufT